MAAGRPRVNAERDLPRPVYHGEEELPESSAMKFCLNFLNLFTCSSACEGNGGGRVIAAEVLCPSGWPAIDGSPEGGNSQFVSQKPALWPGRFNGASSSRQRTRCVG